MQKIMRAGIALARLFAQRLAHYLLKLGRSIAHIIGERWRLSFENRRDNFFRAISAKWRLPGYHFIENCAETPDVSAFVHLRATRLFRRHIPHCSGHQSVACCGRRKDFVDRCRSGQLLARKLRNSKI
ncbi:MAG TPA: hypothetical protein VGK72_00920 [Chthoniobacterales bacterium]